MDGTRAIGDDPRRQADVRRVLALVRMVRDPATPGFALMAGIVVVGLGLIVLGWREAARTAYVIAQMPGVVSGALAGLALIGTGLTLLVVQVSRRRDAREIAAIDEALDEAVTVLTKADALLGSRGGG